MQGRVGSEEHNSSQGQEGQHLNVTLRSSPLLNQASVQDLEYLWKAHVEGRHGVNLFEHSLLHLALLQRLRKVDHVKQVLLDSAAHSRPGILRGRQAGLAGGGS